MNKLLRLWFNLGPSLLCEVTAMAFFFWADWHVGVGYLFVWLSEISAKRIIASEQSLTDLKQWAEKHIAPDDKEDK